MKKKMFIPFLVALLVSTASMAQVLSPSDGVVQLPSITTLKVDKEIYQFASRGHLMGDGHRAYVVQVNGNDLAAFIETSIPLDPKWSHGSMQKYRLSLEALEWIEQWMEVHETKDEFNQVINLAELKKQDGLFLRVETKRKSSGNLSDATLWIIRPDENQIIMLNENT